jgi:hypothetical protein
MSKPRYLRFVARESSENTWKAIILPCSCSMEPKDGEKLSLCERNFDEAWTWWILHRSTRCAS